MAEAEPLTVDRAVELATAYLAAWTERRSPARRRLLEHCWSETCTFSSWTVNVQGFDAMDAHIAAALRLQPRRCRRLRTCEVHVRNGKLSFTWMLVDEHDQILLEGSEFAEVGDDGRFERVTSFAGRPHARSEPSYTGMSGTTPAEAEPQDS